MKKILFVCEGNVTRSQIAEGFLKSYSSDFIVRSAGLRPGGFISKKAILVMKEKGIDLSVQTSKPLTSKDIAWADIIVAIGCKLPCTTKKVLYWDIKDAKGKPLEFYREIRDEIETKVKELVTKIIYV